MAPEQDLKIVGSYYFPYEADIARSLLEANDIPAWVLDDLQVQQRWFLAQALGGVKVAVRAADEVRARELLAQDHSAELSAAPLALQPPAAEELCPRCGSTPQEEGMERMSPRLRDVLLAIGSFLVGVGAPFRRTRINRTCAVCGHRWSQISA